MCPKHNEEYIQYKDRKRCKSCNKEHQARWFKNNKETQRSRSKVTRSNQRIINQQFIKDFFSTHPCIDCNEDNFIVLQFDHIKGKKSFNIGTAIYEGYSLFRIKKEIEKCEVRCANCHIKKTAKDNKSWRTK